MPLAPQPDSRSRGRRACDGRIPMACAMCARTGHQILKGATETRSPNRPASVAVLDDCAVDPSERIDAATKQARPDAGRINVPGSDRIEADTQRTAFQRHDGKR